MIMANPPRFSLYTSVLYGATQGGAFRAQSAQALHMSLILVCYGNILMKGRLDKIVHIQDVRTRAKTTQCLVDQTLCV